jgi:branched-chain amino acid transport system substrate-binding protein
METTMTSRSIFLSIALAISVASPAVQAQPQPTVVGVIYPIKTLVGQQGKRGTELAVEMLNSSGGVSGGSQVKVVVYDDNFSPAEAVAAARRLASEDKVSVIVGTINSAVAMGVVQIAKQNQQLFLGAVTKAPGVTEYDRGFRFNPTAATDGDVLNKYLIDKVNPKRLVVISENGDYGRLSLASMKAAFGSAMAGSELFEILKQTDFSTLSTRVKSMNPDLVCIAATNLEQSGSLLRAMQEAGVPGKRCMLPGSVTPALVTVAGPAAEGIFTLDIWSPSMKNELNTRFVTAFEAKYHETPNKVDYLGFESMWVLGQAMRKAGTNSDTAKLASTIAGSSWDTPRGQVRFAANQAVPPTWVTMTVRGGKIVTD